MQRLANIIGNTCIYEGRVRNDSIYDHIHIYVNSLFLLISSSFAEIYSRQSGKLEVELAEDIFTTFTCFRTQSLEHNYFHPWGTESLRRKFWRVTHDSRYVSSRWMWVISPSMCMFSTSYSSKKDLFLQTHFLRKFVIFFADDEYFSSLLVSKPLLTWKQFLLLISSRIIDFMIILDVVQWFQIPQRWENFWKVAAIAIPISPGSTSWIFVRILSMIVSNRK